MGDPPALPGDIYMICSKVVPGRKLPVAASLKGMKYALNREYTERYLMQRPIFRCRY
jgi:hypothetical protein